MNVSTGGVVKTLEDEAARILKGVQVGSREKAIIHGVLSLCHVFGIKLPGWLAELLLTIAGVEAA